MFVCAWVVMPKGMCSSPLQHLEPWILSEDGVERERAICCYLELLRTYLAQADQNEVLSFRTTCSFCDINTGTYILYMLCDLMWGARKEIYICFLHFPISLLG